LRTRLYRKLIDAAAELVDLPDWTYGGLPWGSIRCGGERFTAGEWLEGLILAESGGDPNAVRYEPHQDRSDRHDHAADPDTPDHDDELLEDDTSYGLCQVLGTNIRRLTGLAPGTPQHHGFALEPIESLRLGLRVLLEELKATGRDVPRALARYNGGPTGDRIEASGEMRRQAYVERVYRHALAVRGDRRRA
jgi:hypothetical protein